MARWDELPGQARDYQLRLEKKIRRQLRFRRRKAIVELKRSYLRMIHLTERIVLGPLTPRLRMPHNVVFRWEKCQLLQYAPKGAPRYATPVVIIPPLMVTPDIFDLRPGHSMVESLLDAGLPVFLFDFGIPEKEDRTITVNDYVLEFIPQAVERVREITGEAEVSMVGWSMGGIMILLYTAIHEERPGGSGVRNIVTLGSPVDFGKLFPFNILIHFAHSPLSRAIDLFGNIPPFLTRNGFKLLAPLASLRRYRLLWEHYYDREWVAGFETIQDWADSFIPYPGAAFKQFITDFIKEDKLRSKKLEIGEHVVDLSRVKSALLAFSGTTDKVAVPPSVDPVVELVGSSDTTIEHVPLGHIGMVAGSGAPKYVWAPMTAWLAERSKPVASEQPRASKKAMRRRRTRRPPERGTSKTLPPDSSI